MLIWAGFIGDVAGSNLTGRGYLVDEAILQRSKKNMLVGMECSVVRSLNRWSH